MRTLASKYIAKRKEDERLARVNATVTPIVKNNSDGKLVHIKKEQLCDILTKQINSADFLTHLDSIYWRPDWHINNNNRFSDN